MKTAFNRGGWAITKVYARERGRSITPERPKGIETQSQWYADKGFSITAKTQNVVIEVLEEKGGSAENRSSDL